MKLSAPSNTRRQFVRKQYGQPMQLGSAFTDMRDSLENQIVGAFTSPTTAKTPAVVKPVPKPETTFFGLSLPVIGIGAVALLLARKFRLF